MVRFFEKEGMGDWKPYYFHADDGSTLEKLKDKYL